MPVTLVLAEMEGERVRERVVRILQPAPKAFKAFDFQGAIWKIIPELGGGSIFEGSGSRPFFSWCFCRNRKRSLD